MKIMLFLGMPITFVGSLWMVTDTFHTLMTLPFNAGLLFYAPFAAFKIVLSWVGVIIFGRAARTVLKPGYWRTPVLKVDREGIYLLLSLAGECFTPWSDIYSIYNRGAELVNVDFKTPPQRVGIMRQVWKLNRFMGLGDLNWSVKSYKKKPDAIWRVLDEMAPPEVLRDQRRPKEHSLG